MNDEEREARDAKDDYESEQYDVDKDRAALEAYESSVETVNNLGETHAG